MEKLSTIIPAYQAARYLGEAVESVRLQAWPGEAEIIVVDDGSTDATFEIARRCGVRAYRQPHGGAARARNLGLRHASGEWILFLDADDMLTEGALAALRAPFEGRPELAAAFGRAEDFISPELTAREARALRIREGSYFGMLTGCALIRWRVFAAIGGFDEALPSGETVAWQLKLRASGLPVERVDAVTLRRRMHRSNTGRVRRDQELQSYAAILRRRMKGR